MLDLVLVGFHYLLSIKQFEFYKRKAKMSAINIKNILILVSVIFV